MRKKKISRLSKKVSPREQDWLDLERLAQVEITSESDSHPVESALTADTGPGWRAAEPGEQRIRINFDQPVNLRRILLIFHEEEQGRTQEFVLRWSPDGGQSYREIVRQQYNFSPPATTQEVEDYGVELNGVTALELHIVPDIGGSDACATLAQLRLA